ncbi:MAG: DUF1223 domain-containing protein [Henriciella sp.]|nr:DUF1223 domain-containing protein [Henriciella sp.]
MIRFFALFAWLFAALAPSALADENPIVIELFASQNCPACPKAHRTLRSVEAENDDVLVLTWSVDYWDYLGAADPMAMPEAKTRQAAYVDRMSLRSPYTPQTVYDGVKECPGTRRKIVDENIAARRNEHAATAPGLSQIGSSIQISGGSLEHPGQVLEVMLIEYLSPEAHTTGMVNPIISTRKLGLWSGAGISYNAACKQSCAVLLQEPGYGKIITALGLD